MFLVYEIIAFELVAGKSLYLDENRYDLSSTF